MKVLTLCLLGVLLTYYASAQEPVQWSFSAKKKSNKTYELHLTASLETGWHIYSQFLPNGGPLPTAVKYVKNPLVNFKTEKLKEVGVLETKYDFSFGMEVKYYHNKVDFIQLLELTSNKLTSIKGTIEYMGCNEEMCLPPQFQNFEIILN